jgi:2-phosphosulfolactate phosphatase
MTNANPDRERPRVFVHLLPAQIPQGMLRGGVAVVIDVLRASTVMVHALAAGCAAIIPCREIDEAREAAEALPAGSAILCGERGGLPIEGFDLGNSPGDFTPELCQDRTLVMTTTNGTRAILASLDADRVYIASFANLQATCDEVTVPFLERDHGRPVHLVCSGTEGFVSLEDTLLAGALASRIAAVVAETGGSATDPPFGNDEAAIAALQWAEVERSMSLSEPGRSLAEILRWGRGGRNVQRIGLSADIPVAAAIDTRPLVAELARDQEPLRIVKI